MVERPWLVGDVTHGPGVIFVCVCVFFAMDDKACGTNRGWHYTVKTTSLSWSRSLIQRYFKMPRVNYVDGDRLEEGLLEVAQSIDKRCSSSLAVGFTRRLC